MTRADHIISLVLAEDRMPAMQAKWADKLNTSHDTRLTLSNDQHVRAHAALRHLHDMDPTPNKQYMGKLVDWYHRGQFRVEDKDRISNAVKDFHSLKNRLKPEHAGPEVANPKATAIGLASQDKASPELLHAIVKDQSSGYAYMPVATVRALSNRNTPAHALELAHTTWGADAHEALAKHPNTPTHVLQQIKDHPYASDSTKQHIAGRLKQGGVQ